MSLLTSVLSRMKTLNRIRLPSPELVLPPGRSRTDFRWLLPPARTRSWKKRCSAPAVESHLFKHSVPPGSEGERDMPEFNLRVIGARPATGSNSVSNLPLGTEERSNDTNQY